MTDRLADLLVSRATEGLSDADERELQQLLEAEGLEGLDDYELAAAAAARAFAEREHARSGALPEGLRSRLLEDADGFFGSEEDASAGNVTRLDEARDARRAQVSTPTHSMASGMAGKLGWAVAAMLVLVILLNTGRDADAPAPIDPAQARAELISSHPATRVLPWAQPDMAAYAGVRGDVTWNDELQEGYMRLSGLPVNDPGKAQYQLWIVDPARDQRPVDGGVFDVPAGPGEVVIPIDAKLAVQNPAAFAITLEKPGGVVVSAGPLLVIASG